MSGKRTRNIVLLGKTGSGKSSLANTITGKKDQFKTNDSPASVTKQCESYTTTVKGNNINVIDTPGFFDTNPSSTEKNNCQDLSMCIDKCKEGVHAFLLVFKVERFTQHEQAVVQLIEEYFSEEAFKYTIVVFTHGNELEDGKTIEKWISENEALNDLVQKCGGRCYAFDNKHWNKTLKNHNKKQIKELLKTIDEISKKNGDCYKSDIIKNINMKSDQKSTAGWLQIYSWFEQQKIPFGIMLAAFLGKVLLVKSGGTWVLTTTAVAQGAKLGLNALQTTGAWASKWWASPTEAMKESIDFLTKLEDLFKQVQKTAAEANTTFSLCTIQ